MAMNDEETVAYCRRTHTRKNSRCCDPICYVGAEPAGASIEEQSSGWRNTYGTGNGADTILSGLEGADYYMINWSNNYFENLFGYEWELTVQQGHTNGTSR
jgi:catalase-peroxidase